MNKFAFIILLLLPNFVPVQLISVYNCYGLIQHNQDFKSLVKPLF